MLVIENDQLPDPLASIIRGLKCTVVIGSGPSDLSYFSWADLVNALCTASGIPRRVSGESPAKEFLVAAQEAKTANPLAYFTWLGNHFGRPIDQVPRLYQLLLSLPFDCYMTFNFDPSLAAGAQVAQTKCRLPVNAYPSLDLRKAGQRSLHHLHGFIPVGGMPKDGEIVLANGEFEQAYSANSNLLNFLVPTLENEPVLFVGCGLQEPTMAEVFGICKRHQLERLRLMRETGAPESQPPPRFITLRVPYVTNDVGVHDPDRSAHEQQKLHAYYEALDITPVWYNGQGNDHSGLLRALESFAELPKVTPEHGWVGILNDN
jgi:SIR2-like protein